MKEKNLLLSHQSLCCRTFLSNEIETVKTFISILATTYNLDFDPDDGNYWSSEDEAVHIQLHYLKAENIVMIEFFQICEGDRFNNCEKFIKTYNAAFESALLQNTSLEVYGITVIFRGTVDDDKNLDQLDMNNLFSPDQKRLYSFELSQNIPEGRMWLLAASELNHSDHSETTYLVLSHKKNMHVIQNYLNDLSFIWPDLIAHDAFRCTKLYRADQEENNLDDLMINLSEKAKEILADEETQSKMLDKQLKHLSSAYNDLFKLSLNFLFQEKHLEQQKWNFSSFVCDPHLNPLFEFLGKQVDNNYHELKIKNEQIHQLLDSTGQVVSIVRTRIESSKEIRQRRIEYMLAFFGIALAVPQLLTYDVLTKIIKNQCITSFPWLIFIIQISLTILIAFIISVAAYLWSQNKKSKKSRTN